MNISNNGKKGIERIKMHEISCLVGDIRNLNKRPSMELWALYKVDNRVFFLRKIHGGKIFKEIKAGDKPYYSKTCYQFVEPRLTNEKGNAVNSEGYELIEHVVDIKDIVY